MNRSADEYRRQLVRCAQALAVGRADAVAAELKAGSTAEHIRLFTEPNLQKRQAKLCAQAALLEDELDDFAACVRQYVQHVPAEALNAGAVDCDHFLQWITASRRLTPAQQDVVACLHGRHAVEALARRRRAAYLHFHDLRSIGGRHEQELGGNSAPGIHLNPIHAWATFQTNRLVDEETELPAQVLFYAVDGEVRTAVLDDGSAELIRLLENIAPCTLDIWTAHAATEPDDLAPLCRDLAEMGLLAFG